MSPRPHFFGVELHQENVTVFSINIAVDKFIFMSLKLISA
jgi:hypothetical protein